MHFDTYDAFVTMYVQIHTLAATRIPQVEKDCLHRGKLADIDARDIFF